MHSATLLLFMCKSVEAQISTLLPAAINNIGRSADSMCLSNNTPMVWQDPEDLLVFQGAGSDIAWLQQDFSLHIPPGARAFGATHLRAGAMLRCSRHWARWKAIKHLPLFAPNITFTLSHVHNFNITEGEGLMLSVSVSLGGTVRTRGAGFDAGTIGASFLCCAPAFFALTIRRFPRFTLPLPATLPLAVGFADGSRCTRARRDIGATRTWQIDFLALPIARRHRQRDPTCAIPRLPGVHLREPLLDTGATHSPRAACHVHASAAASLIAETPAHFGPTVRPPPAETPVASRVLPVCASIRATSFDFKPIEDFALSTLPHNPRVYRNYGSRFRFCLKLRLFEHLSLKPGAASFDLQPGFVALCCPPHPRIHPATSLRTLIISDCMGEMGLFFDPGFLKQSTMPPPPSPCPPAHDLAHCLSPGDNSLMLAHAHADELTWAAASVSVETDLFYGFVFPHRAGSVVGGWLCPALHHLCARIYHGAPPNAHKHLQASFLVSDFLRSMVLNVFGVYVPEYC
ncbi:hypothetical protein B0H15DRAFT_995334 [Mycena belliarum]|uniref:Uncharacterized protein n=1 Tax=Mycena belliarum TaxID=1033014 RepID=A0AAD6UED2_9AGAR|nr:hypothetical protein B0H15DRAFT_995334 [Mycena belliae]